MIPRTLKNLFAKPPRRPVPSLAVIVILIGKPLSLAISTSSFASLDLAPIIDLPSLPSPFVIKGVSVAAPAFQAKAVKAASAAFAIISVLTSFGDIPSKSDAIASMIATPAVSFNAS